MTGSSSRINPVSPRLKAPIECRHGKGRLSYDVTPLRSYRLAQARTIEETLCALMTLGDDRVVRQTWSAGQLVHERYASST